MDQPGVEVNCRDEEGRTLLSLVMTQMDSQTCGFVEKILSLGGDPNLKDFNENTALHHLASFYVKNKATINNYSSSEKEDTFTLIGRVAKMLIDADADLSLQNTGNQTAFEIAMKSEQTHFLQQVVPKLSFSVNPSLMFLFTGNMLLNT